MSAKELCSRIRRSARIAAQRASAIKSTGGDRHQNQQLAVKRTNNTAEKKKSVTQRRNCNIFSLNDDCILKIFSYLTLQDIFTINDIDERFSYLAYKIAQKMFREGEYVCLPEKPGDQVSMRNASLDQVLMQHSSDELAALMLIKFGKFITHLHIDDSRAFILFCNTYKSGWSFMSMMINCTALKCIRFKDIYYSSDLVGFEKIFQNVETFELKQSPALTLDLTPILSVSKKLKNITLEVYSIIGLLAFTELVNLESICFKATFSSYFNVVFLYQLECMQHLKKLDLGCIYQQITVPRINALANIVWLEELNLECYVANENAFKALNKLIQVASGTLYIHARREISADALTFVNNFVITVVKHNTLYTSSLYAYTYTLVPKNAIIEH